MPKTVPDGQVPFAIDPLAARPQANAEQAAAVASELWGIKTRATPLPGERDRNFLLQDNRGARFVLKISGGAEDRRRLELQERLIGYARERDANLRLPEALADPAGRTLATYPFESGDHHVRLFRYAEGVPLSTFRRRPHALLESVGRLLGRLQSALNGFDHPGLDLQDIPWAPVHAASVIASASEVLGERGPGRLYRRVADSVLGDLPRLLALPAAALHNDANDDNLLLVAGEAESAEPEHFALLDFGDALRGPSIIEAATGALYVAAATAEPLPAAARVLAGFARELAVSEEEADLFRTAIATRALVSAGVAALRRAHVPEAAAEEYLLVSETGVWAFLQALDDEAPDVTDGRFRMAAGHAPLPRAATKAAAVRRAAERAAPPIAPAPHVCILDLSPECPTLDPAAALEILHQTVTAATDGGKRAIGRHLEPRFSEIAPAERPGCRKDEPATLSLGIEVFADPGTPVRAVLDGEVAWTTDNCGSFGGGLTLGLKHEAGKETFWTSYRHLDRGSLSHLGPGDCVRRGAMLGALANAPNEGWPPHLHFQVLLSDLGGDPPRMSNGRDLAVLSALSPDPSPFLGLDPSAAVAAGTLENTEGRLLEARTRRFSHALSIAYDTPIQVVRGRGAKLYDQAGRDFLDMVNNVCHVGHAHPRVVEAIRAQAQLLNTNTRYLYRQLTDYAERLAATLPAPLEVVFLTNSGSEANDLALRIARTHLGRQETLVFAGGYHGNLTSLIEVSPYKLDGRGGRPGPSWLHRLPMPDGFRGRFRDQEPQFAASLIADAESRVRQAGPATLIGEAILSCGGQIVPPPGYLKALYRAVRNTGGVIVADEVQTGFGRVGPAFWAFIAVQDGEESVCPDIVTLGKPAGNGHPLGAVVTTRELARSFENGMEYFNTFGGNPVSRAAGLAVLDVIRDERLAEHADTVGGQLLEGLKALQNRYPILGQVRGRGLFLGFEMVRDPASREPAPREARRLVNRLREFRILNSTDGPDANVVKLKPPLAFSSDDTAHYLDTLETVLEEQF